MWCKYWFDLTWTADVLNCFPVCFFTLFNSFRFTEFLTKEILLNLRVTRRDYVCHIGRNSKQVYDVLETFYPNGNCNKFICLNISATSILNEIDKIKDFEEQALSQLNGDLGNQMDQILTHKDEHLHTMHKIDLDLFIRFIILKLRKIKSSFVKAKDRKIWRRCY